MTYWIFWAEERQFRRKITLAIWEHFSTGSFGPAMKISSITLRNNERAKAGNVLCDGSSVIGYARTAGAVYWQLEL